MIAKTVLAVILPTLLLGGAVFAQQSKHMPRPNRETLNSADRTFVNNAEQANLAEIETAKAVEQKATDPAVKDFASRMVTDHTQASQELSTLAKNVDITLPTEPSPKERTEQSKLENLSGSKLDLTYVRDELDGHKDVISSFQNEIEHGRDEAVKAYAEETLPTLEDHIRIAENIAGKMDMSGKAGLNQEDKAIAAK
jgi:putative membrane protein